MAIGSDHTGLALKRALVAHLRGRGLAVDDLGTDTTEPVTIRTWPARVATRVARGEADAGIVIDGAGIGSAIAANKVRGIRAAMCTTETHRAVLARAQRRQRHHARFVAARRSDEARPHRRHLDRHADAGGAIHPAAAEDPAAGGAVLMRPQMQPARSERRSMLTHTTFSG